MECVVCFDINYILDCHTTFNLSKHENSTLTCPVEFHTSGQESYTHLLYNLRDTSTNRILEA